MIYLLEDDDNIRDFVLYALTGQGFEAQGFARPSLFWQAMAQRPCDLLLLDLMLPEEDGLQILKRLRAESATRSLPILLLTAKGTEFDKVIGLDSGADDYLPKPFSMLELISRIKALLRRSQQAPHREEFSVGGLQVDVQRHIVSANGADVTLTNKEFSLLTMLLENQGRVLTRNQIQDKIWGYEFDGESRTVDVHIRTLRQKLGECGTLIQTVRGVGYKIGD